jgi:hypothetical protein
MIAMPERLSVRLIFTKNRNLKMKRSIILLSVVLLLSGQMAHADVPSTKLLAQAEPGANTQDLPTPILKTGINLNTPALSPNTLQLSNTIGLTPILEQIQSLRQRVSQNGQGDLGARVDLMEAVQKAEVLLARTNLEIDFTLAQINAEDEVYNEVLAKFTSDRDKLVARVNAASFISNGILWAVCEAFSIGSFNTTFAKNPKKVIQWPIPSGIVGIAAGIVPSVASMYTLKAVNGKRKCQRANRICWQSSSTIRPIPRSNIRGQFGSFSIKCRPISPKARHDLTRLLIDGLPIRTCPTLRTGTRKSSSTSLRRV